MKKMCFLVLWGLMFVSLIRADEPVPGAEVYIEQEHNDLPVACQVTGSSGTVSFNNLDKSVYRVCVVLPKLEGKLIKGKEKVKSDARSVYNPDKKVYYIREPQGFFAVKFDNFKRVAGANISLAYETIRSYGREKLLIGRFAVADNLGEITVKIEGITPKDFQSKVTKVKHDIA